jgi:hypothetical protein
MNFEAIEEAKKKAKSGNLSPEVEAHLNESYPEVRPGTSRWRTTKEGWDESSLQGGSGEAAKRGPRSSRDRPRAWYGL